MSKDAGTIVAVSRGGLQLVSGEGGLQCVRRQVCYTMQYNSMDPQGQDRCLQSRVEVPTTLHVCS